MITDIFYSFIIITFIVFGFSRPYVALAAVLWIDTVKPQNTSFSFLSGKPLSLILTAFFLLTLLVNTKKLRKVNNGAFYILFFGNLYTTSGYTQSALYYFLERMERVLNFPKL